jgi:holliday junction DNA helicase RuvA
MIAYIDGKLALKEPTYIIVETNGVGYEIKISLNTYTGLKDEERCKILTYLHVREDAQILYGFLEAAEKRMFLDLISVSGIGPNTALTVLSSTSSQELQHAILSENVKAIQSIKGIGPKTAQRLILELKDKVKKDNLNIVSPSLLTKPSHNTLRNEALSALVTLGIQKSVAEKSIDTILKREGDQLSLETLIKLALKTG